MVTSLVIALALALVLVSVSISRRRLEEEDLVTVLPQCNPSNSEIPNFGPPKFAVPATLEEARDRFGKSLEGFWSDADVHWLPDDHIAMTFFPDGRGACRSSHAIQFEWRNVEPFNLEIKFLPSDAGWDDYIWSEDPDYGVWKRYQYSVEELHVSEPTATLFLLKGLPAQFDIFFSGALATDYTYEQMVAECASDLERNGSSVSPLT